MKKTKRNAVLFKEMTVDMKKPKILIIMLLINMLLIPVVLSFFLAIYIQGNSGDLGYRILANYFIAMMFTEAGIIAFIVPAVTAGSVSLEKERQTLDVLLTTRLTTWEIIKGKYFSSYLTIVLLVLSTMPMMSLVFIYGGIGIWQMIYVFIVLYVYIAMIASFGVFFSALTKNTVASVVLTYIFTLSYLVFTAVLPWIVVGGIELVNLMIYEDHKYFNFITDQHLIPSDYFIMLGIGNPFYAIFDSIGHTIGYSIEGIGIQGVNSLGEILPHTSDKNIVFRMFTPISMVFQLVVTFILLKISAVFLNPVKAKKNKKRK